MSRALAPERTLFQGFTQCASSCKRPYMHGPAQDGGSRGGVPTAWVEDPECRLAIKTALATAGGRPGLQSRHRASKSTRALAPEGILFQDFTQCASGCKRPYRRGPAPDGGSRSIHASECRHAIKAASATGFFVAPWFTRRILNPNQHPALPGGIAPTPNLLPLTPPGSVVRQGTTSVVPQESEKKRRALAPKGSLFPDFAPRAAMANDPMCDGLHQPEGAGAFMPLNAASQSKRL